MFGRWWRGFDLWQKARVAVVLLAVVLVLGSTWFVFEWLGQRRLAAALEAARQADIPLTVAELDARRKAATPNAEQVYEIRAIGERIDEVARKAGEDSPLMQHVIWFGPPAHSALGEPLSEEVLETQRQFVAEWRPELERLRELAKTVRGAHAKDWTESAYWHLTPHRTATRALIVSAMVATDAGDLDTARDSLVSALRLSRLMKCQPTSIEVCCAGSYDSMSLRGLEYALSRRAFSDADLVVLQQAIEEAEQEYDLEPILSNMLADNVQMILDMPRQMIEEAESGSQRLRLRLLMLIPGQVSGDTAAAIRTFTEQMAAAEMDLADAESWMRAEENRLCRSATRDEYGMFVGGMGLLTNMVRCNVDSMAKAVARTRCARAALAAERYRRAEGGWPESLDALVPQYLDAQLRDPFGGEPLHYSISENGIVVWSIGQDMTDDGGVLDAVKDYEHAPDLGFELRLPRVEQ